MKNNSRIWIPNNSHTFQFPPISTSDLSSLTQPSQTTGLQKLSDLPHQFVSILLWRVCVERSQESLIVSTRNLKKKKIRLLHCVHSHRILHYLLSCLCLIYYQVCSLGALDESKQLCSCNSPVMIQYSKSCAGEMLSINLCSVSEASFLSLNKPHEVW